VIGRRRAAGGPAARQVSGEFLGVRPDSGILRPKETPMNTTRLIGTLTTLSLAVTSAVALAQAPKPAAAPAATDKKPMAPAAAAPAAGGASPAAAAAPAGPPKPAAELDQLKWMEASWKCDGKAPAGPMGPEHPYKSTMKVKRDLDGFWLATEYEQKKSKENPFSVKARGFLGYDPIAKKYASYGVDNVGGMIQLTGSLEGDKLTSIGEGSMGGQKIGFQEVITKTGDKTLTWHGEMKMGKDWIVIGDDSCKK
jgi:hypothetical protein